MIYILDRDPAIAARMLADETLIKSIAEIAEVLRRAHEMESQDPLICWARSDRLAYDWMYLYYECALIRFHNRFKRQHAMWRSSIELRDRPTEILNTGWLRPPPQCVSRRYRQSDSVEAYRHAYFDHCPTRHWSAPDSMPDWFSARLTRAIKELQ